MNLSDIPAWFAKRFAADATGSYVRTIPTTSADPAAASLSLGFPPNTFADIGAGGTPPDGRDFNGILNQLSAWAQWSGLGAAVPWSNTISTAAGGYPLGAIVLSNSVTGRLYQSQVNANVTNPDTGGAGWAILVDKAASSGDIAAGTSNELVVTPLHIARIDQPLLCLRVGRRVLILLAEMPAAALFPLQRIAAHQLAQFDEVTHTAGLPRNPDVPPRAVDRGPSRDELMRQLGQLPRKAAAPVWGARRGQLPGRRPIQRYPTLSPPGGGGSVGYGPTC